MAVETYGPTADSEALLQALGMPRPESWDAVEAGAAGAADGMEEEEEEEGEEEADEEGEQEPVDAEAEYGEDDDGGGGGAGAGAGAGAGGSDGGNNSSDSRSRSRSHDDDEYPPTEEEAEPTDVDVDAGSRRRLPAIAVSDALAKQLDAFERFRCQTVNRQRKGKAVATVTARDDRRSVLHFFAWLKARKGVTVPTFGVFSSARLGAVAEEFIEEKALTCQHARIAKLLSSLVAATRFTYTMLKAKAAEGTSVSSAPADEMEALLSQVKGEAVEEGKFRVSLPPKSWLTWEECQIARLRSEKALAKYKGSDAAEKLSLVRSCCLLKLLTAIPPDRVRVYRELQLGGSLKAAGGGSYKIDLERGAHKTSSTFGPSRCTLPEPVAERVHALVTMDGLQSGEYLFHGTDRGAALETWTWTRLVQATFKAYSPGSVALSPKDCRASFVTWMRDGDHGDDVLASAAKSMHHSNATAASASYDKHGSDRIVGAAMKAAGEFAQRFA